MQDFKMIVASAAHDMKNHLLVLQQQIENLSEYQVPVECVQRMRDHGLRLQNDLMQLLAWYQLEEGVYRQQRRPHVVSDFIQEQIWRHQDMASERGITLSVGSVEDTVALFDAFLLGTVLQNTLMNAIRYAKASVQLSAYRKPCALETEVGGQVAEWMTWEVADDGPGYPDTQALAEGGLTHAQCADLSSGGTGLGLFFARHVALQHGTDNLPGRIFLDNESALGGARFRLLVWAPDEAADPFLI